MILVFKVRFLVLALGLVLDLVCQVDAIHTSVFLAYCWGKYWRTKNICLPWLSAE